MLWLAQETRLMEYRSSYSLLGHRTEENIPHSSNLSVGRTVKLNIVPQCVEAGDIICARPGWLHLARSEKDWTA